MFIPYNAEIILYITMETKGVFQFETTRNVLVSSFCFIWIPMLWVWGYYKYFYSYSAGIDFSRQNLTSTDVRFWRLKSIPANIFWINHGDQWCFFLFETPRNVLVSSFRFIRIPMLWVYGLYKCFTLSVWRSPRCKGYYIVIYYVHWLVLFV